MGIDDRMGAPVVLSDEPASAAGTIITPAEGEGIPGEVNIEWYKTVLEGLQPDRFQSIRLLHDKCRHDESPVLVAHDKGQNEAVMLQVFTTKEEFRRTYECATRCCNLHIEHTAAIPVTPGSPGGCYSPISPSSSTNREPWVCCITEVHSDAAVRQWCAVFEAHRGEKS